MVYYEQHCASIRPLPSQVKKPHYSSLMSTPSIFRLLIYDRSAQATRIWVAAFWWLRKPLHSMMIIKIKNGVLTIAMLRRGTMRGKLEAL